MVECESEMSTTNCQSHSVGVINHALLDKLDAQGVRLGQHFSEFCQRDLEVLQRQLELPSAGVVDYMYCKIGAQSLFQYY